MPEDRDATTRESNQGGPSSNSQDLKEREYRDNQGNVHHHTHTSEEMKDKKAS